MSTHYADENVFRASNGSETMEVRSGYRTDDVIVSIDYWDGPEQSIRLDPDDIKVLALWLSKKATS